MGVIGRQAKGVSFSGSAKFVDDAVAIVYCNVQYNYAQGIATPGAEHRVLALTEAAY